MKARASGLRPQRISSRRTLSTTARRTNAVSDRFWQAKNPLANRASTRIAILGGGITGLAYAYLISKVAPKARISLFERSSRLGGWLQSTRLKSGGEDVVFEHGPRSLRPALTAAGLAAVDLIRDLGIEPEILPTSKNSPAARNRYVYYPDRLNCMPDPQKGFLALLEEFSKPIWQGSIWPLFLEFLRPKRREGLDDESVGSFLRRRFSAAFADNIASAMLHGIYAGDIDKLSVKSLAPQFWDAESSAGSVTRSIIRSLRSKQVWRTPEDFELQLDLAHKLLAGAPQEPGRPNSAMPPWRRSSIYTFNGGLERLATSLIAALERTPNVEIHRSTAVTGLRPVASASGHTVEVSTISPKGNTEQNTFTHVASALPAQSLLSACEASDIMSAQEALDYAVPSVTVMVVNLYYRQPGLLPVKGFGYLIPRSVPTKNNPEQALGVVFDSDATPAVDDSTGTKLTVMLGGHWWDGRTDLPSAEEGIEMAKSVVENHLGITAEPTATAATLQKDCIPQYVVGHHQKSQALHQKLEDEYHGSLDAFGASWDGVSVNDCIKAAYTAARRFQQGKKREIPAPPAQLYDTTRIQ